MADDIEEELDVKFIREALYGDAFSRGTDKVGRYLLVVATTTLITTVFNVVLKSTPLVPLDFSGQPDSLITFLAAANLALLINYTLRVTNDLLKAREDWANAQRFMDIERIKRARQSAQWTEEIVMSGDPSGDPGPDADPWWEHYAETRDEAVRRIRMIQTRPNERRVAITTRWIRLVFLGGSPALIGVAALMHTWRNVWHFFQAIVGL